MQVIGHNYIAQNSVQLLSEAFKKIVDRIKPLSYFNKTYPVIAGKSDKINSVPTYFSVNRHPRKIVEFMLSKMLF